MIANKFSTKRIVQILRAIIAVFRRQISQACQQAVERLRGRSSLWWMTACLKGDAP